MQDDFQPFLGEIRLFAFTLGGQAPAGWHLCDGSKLSIQQYNALFSLLGTAYGGDGQRTFALPDLRSRVPMGAGGNFALGTITGVETVTLTEQQMPHHTHAFLVSTAAGNTGEPTGNYLADSRPLQLFTPGGPNVRLAPASISEAGESQPHTNLQPYLALQYCIAIQGLYPMAE